MAGEFFTTTAEQAVSNTYVPTEKIVQVQMQSLEGAIVKIMGRVNAAAEFDVVWTSSSYVGRPVSIIAFPEMQFSVENNKPGNKVQIWVSG